MAGLLAFATETALVVLLTLYLQDVLGVGAVAAGLALAVLGDGLLPGGRAAGGAGAQDCGPRTWATSFFGARTQ